MNPNPFVVVPLAVLLAACAAAQGGAMSLVRKAETRGDYRECLQHLAGAESYGELAEDGKAQVAFQRGICLEGLNRKSEAFALYRHVIMRYPGSVWAAQARGRLEFHAQPN